MPKRLKELVYTNIAQEHPGYLTQITLGEETLKGINYSLEDVVLIVPEAQAFKSIDAQMFLPFNEAIDFFKKIEQASINNTPFIFHIDQYYVLAETLTLTISTSPIGGEVNINGIIINTAPKKLIKEVPENINQTISVSNEKIKKRKVSFNALTLSYHIALTKHNTNRGNKVVIYGTYPAQIDCSFLVLPTTSISLPKAGDKTTLRAFDEISPIDVSNSILITNVAITPRPYGEYMLNISGYINV
jgi:hypothetical protein